jgi:hypothetical protein
MKSVRKVVVVAVVLLTVATALSCYPVLKKEAQQPEEALRQVRLFFPKFSDDMDRDSLVLAVTRSLEYLDRLPPETVFRVCL